VRSISSRFLLLELEGGTEGAGGASTYDQAIVKGVDKGTSFWVKHIATESDIVCRSLGRQGRGLIRFRRLAQFLHFERIAILYHFLLELLLGCLEIKPSRLI
jgi:hypothetical protein